MPTAVSIFSGCGGSDLGLRDAGFDILLANDVSRYACNTYKLNMPETEVICGDVSGIKHFPNADILIGCYPCQGFSQGGARQHDRSINYLYREFDRALRLIKPKAFIVENVSGMIRSNNKKLLMNQVYRFRMAGYKVTGPALLNAYEFGVPQIRKRVFIVGIRSDLGIEYKFPQPSHGPNGRRRGRTQEDVLAGLPEWPEGEFYNKGFHWYYLSRNRRKGWNEPSATIVSNLRHMPLHPMSPPLVKHGDDDWRFAYDGPARRFTYREAALLQGFPRRFKFADGSLTQKHKAVGNAVPPPLFTAVVEALPNIW
jgi:DNA (cytosine-5)-methyltransferase 1